jgi:hypothetical protein
MYCSASSALAIPPTPITGTRTARRTFQVASTPMGSRPGPLTPPVPNPSAGRRRFTSTTKPGSVFTTVSASAPALTAIRAVAPMSDSVGESFTKIRRRVTPRTCETIVASVAGSLTNSAPPALAFGQLTLSSYPSIAVERSTAPTPSASSIPMTTDGKSSVVAPTTFTSLRVFGRWAPSHARWSRRTVSSPGFARPTALIMPARKSATRNAGLPWRGSGLTALVTMPPSRSRSTTSSSSRA